MSKIALLSLFLTFGLPQAFADHHEEEKCTCTKECKDNCEKGKSKDCECKNCDCKESGHCKK